MPDQQETEPQSPMTPEAQRRLLRWVRSVLRLKTHPSLRASLTNVLAEPHETDAFSPEERVILRNVLGLRERRVDDVMVPRADIVAVEEQTNLGDLLNVFREAGHSRLPVYRETLDDPVGMVHIKDLVSYLLSGAVLKAEDGTPRRRRAQALQHLAKVDFAKPLAAARIMRPVLFVPPSMPVLDCLVKMQTSRIHMALVIDEYGGTDGLVSIEDLVEEVVGEIEDEHDFEEAPLIRADESGFVIDARAPLQEVGAALGADLATGDDAEDVDTLGGLIVTRVGRVPVRGELIAGPGDLEFEVLDADPRRLKRVRVHRRPPGAREARRPRRSRAEEAAEAARASEPQAVTAPEPAAESEPAGRAEAAEVPPETANAAPEASRPEPLRRSGTGG
jgi:CBS domain containing-hemolysin-like protein